MRTLELNKTTLWIVDTTGEYEDVLDEDGNYTGEKEIQYSIPSMVRLHLYPATGDVVSKSFGKDLDLDMITSSTNVELDKNTLVFLKEPVGNYDTTYDYSVDKILRSLNVFTYGLKGRE